MAPSCLFSLLVQASTILLKGNNQAFLAANKEEFPDRFQTLLLKKNLHLNGFMGIGIMWTQQAYFENLG